MKQSKPEQFKRGVKERIAPKSKIMDDFYRLGYATAGLTIARQQFEQDKAMAAQALQQQQQAAQQQLLQMQAQQAGAQQQAMVQGAGIGAMAAASGQQAGLSQGA